jgi:TIGR03009 family protein
MRRAGLTLSALLAAAPAAFPQAPPAGGTVPKNLAPLPAPPAAPAALPQALVNHLLAWEARHKQVTNLRTECEVVKKNLLYRKETAYAGTILCMKPNYAWLKVDSKTDKADWQAFISNGSSVFEYNAKEKLVVEHRIPKSTPNSVGDNLLMEFMSGTMTANDVIKRFDLTLLKEEEFYVHIQIKPRLPKDLQEFESLTLVLYGPKTANMKLDYLPAVVIIRNNNGQAEEQWTFKKPMVNLENLTVASFQFTKPPGDWKVKQADTTPPDPKVARPSGNR